MAYAFDKHVDTGALNMGTSASLIVPAGGVAVGNLVCVRTCMADAGTVSVSDTQGNTYTALSSQTVQGGVAVRNFVSKLGVALVSGNTITVSSSVKTSGPIAADAWSGDDSATPVAQNEGQGTSATATSGSATPTVTGQLALGLLGYGSAGDGTNDSDTVDGTWVELTRTSFSSQSVDGAYKIVTGVSAQTYDFTLPAGPPPWVCEIAVFSEAITELPRVSPYRQLLGHQ